ncbi:hypothetical protein BDB01DRAFT_786263 [Pilobolus umbonatus]|nr:hypothetical protein BDB01DRAFT_786263 [Pilobolus umbonatus]
MHSNSADIQKVPRSQYVEWCMTHHLYSNTEKESRRIEEDDKQNVKKKKKEEERSFPLPPEMLSEIFSYLSRSQSSLYSASLVCKQWLYCVAPILYCNPRLSDTYSWATFILTLTRNKRLFLYGDLVRSIDLTLVKAVVGRNCRSLSSDLVSSPDNIHIRTFTLPRNASGEVELARIMPARARASRARMSRLTVKTSSHVIVSTSSLLQLSHSCHYITSLNLSNTSLLDDSVVEETGEYLSTIQNYTVQPGLTHTKIPIEAVIKAIGDHCQHLEQVQIQKCDWVTAHVIWMFVYYIPSLCKLDARRSMQCTVKKLILNVLEAYTNPVRENGEDIHLNEYDSDDEDEFTHLSGLFPELIDENTGNIELTRPLHIIIRRNSDGQWVRTFSNNPSAMQAMRRPPSPILPHSLTPPIQTPINHTEYSDKSLKHIVHDILLEERETGALDLNWLLDY